jgi:CelD/BcsL family acetyltransferase involved in cellulose biosynthesis
MVRIAVSTPLPTPLASVSAGRFRFTRHRDVAALEGVWRALAREGGTTAFQSYDWGGAWARAAERSGVATPAVIVVEDDVDDRPIMLVPLAVTAMGARRVATFFDLGVTDYNAPLVAADIAFGRLDTAEIKAGLKAILPDADVLHLDKMPYRVGRTRNPLVAFKGTSAMSLTACAAPIWGPWSSCRESILAPAFRVEMDDRWRRLNKRKPVRFVVAESAEQANDLFDALADQRAARFRRLKRDDILWKSAWRDFYRDLVTAEGGHGLGRMSALLIDGEPVATALGLAHEGTFALMMHGFADGCWRNYSPGIQLILRTMEWAVADGFRTFDFTIGAEGYKNDFGVVAQPLAECVEALSPHGLPRQTLARAKGFVRRHPVVATPLRRMLKGA